MAIKRGLGRGFDSLIPTEVIEEEFDVTASQDNAVSELKNIKLVKIVRNEDQPRKTFDTEELNSLAKSIKEYGVLQPIVVTPKGDKFQIVAGERRFRASQIAGLETIPALIRTLTGQRELETAIIENVQRKDLNPIEFATALAKMRDQFNLTQQQISNKIGKSVAVISSHLRLFALPEEAKKALADGKIMEGHGRQLMALQDNPEAQKTLLNNILKYKWSIHKAEEWVINFKKIGAGGDLRKATRAVSQENNFTRSMSSIIGLPVKQRAKGRGAGELVISYKTDSDLDKIKQVLDII
jgi:ParB family chromosome partitioning protein